MKHLLIPLRPILPVLRWIRRHWILTIVLTLLALPVFGLAWWLAAPKSVEVINAEVKRGTLTQTVEAVGTIISEKDLELKFPITGVVEEVLVTEGDQVEAGEVLARLRNTREQADVNSAAANLQNLTARLRALQEGSRPEDIIIAEAQVANKKAALEAAQKSFETAQANLVKSADKLKELLEERTVALAGNVSTAGSDIVQELSKAESALAAINSDFDNNVVRNAVEFQRYSELEAFRIKEAQVRQSMSVVRQQPLPTTVDQALSQLNQARGTLLQASIAANEAYNIIVSMDTTYYFTSTVKDTYKDSISTDRTTIQTALNNIDSATKTLQDAVASYDTKIATEEATLQNSQGTRDKALADIQTFETSLKIDEANLSLKRAGTRQADIDAAQAQVNQAYAQLQQARARLEDTILEAPIAGRITKANLKAGEFTGDFTDVNRAITMLGDSPYRVEMYASEIDIPKVAYVQTGTVLLDAYPSRDFMVSVTEIDPAATIIDGVPKYRIKLDFTKDYGDAFKIGMTGDTEIITAIKADVLYVPARAVLEREDGTQYVRMLDSKNETIEREVTTGMETATDIEVVTGLNEGEEIVVLIKED